MPDQHSVILKCVTNIQRTTTHLATMVLLDEKELATFLTEHIPMLRGQKLTTKFDAALVRISASWFTHQDIVFTLEQLAKLLSECSTSFRNRKIKVSRPTLETNYKIQVIWFDPNYHESLNDIETPSGFNIVRISDKGN